MLKKSRVDKSANTFICPHYTAHLHFGSPHHSVHHQVQTQNNWYPIADLAKKMVKYKCPYCTKVCKSQHGLVQHQRSSTACKQAREAIEEFKLGDKRSGKNLLSAYLEEEQEGIGLESPSKVQRLMEELKHLHEDNNTSLNTVLAEMGIGSPGVLARNVHEDYGEEEEDEEDDAVEEYSEDEEESSEDDDAESVQMDNEATAFEQPADDFNPYSLIMSDEEDSEYDVHEDNERSPSAETIHAFRAYVGNAYQHFSSLSNNEKKAIKIMSTLIKKKASLDTYEAVMEWHLRETGQLQEGEKLGNCQGYISRQKLMQKLRKRYHMDNKYAQPESVILPHSKAKVIVWHHKARDEVLSLITDPRWEDKDWLYFDEDPFAPPPEDLDYIADVNTGQAYLETYKKLITKPGKQILVGLPLYIDGAVTGQFDKLQVTALKMSITMLNRKARDKEHAWRTLGYVSNYAKEDSRGKKIFIESGHVAASELYVDVTDDEEEGEFTGVEEDVDKAADYHAILEVLLDSVKVLIDEGMVVDLYYKDKLYKDVELVFFVPFVKCDGDEGDKLCLHYRSRGKNIKQLCRYCQCPNEETDDPEANHPYKTEPQMQGLYDNEKLQKLKNLSQVNAKNAFHSLRFGLHNKRGIHGGCPWELLHAVLLGIHKYARDCFFDQMGKSSSTAEEVNSLSKLVGALLSRQSDRNRPRTKFAKGILKGKLMAKEYTGVLLIISALLRCTAGEVLLTSARKKGFREDWRRKDWSLLIETLLQWEAYLNSSQMETKHVKRLKKKHRFIMYLLKKVGHRTIGMGFKVMKFHAILHLAQDILMFGVPMVVDTGSNESHHKTTKVAAKLTQKDIKNFEKQTSDRCDDFHVLHLAEQEMAGRPLWAYFNGYVHNPQVQMEETISTGGMKIEVFWDDEENEPAFRILSRMKNKEAIRLDNEILQCFWEIQEAVADEVSPVQFCAEHNRSGQIFRSHPNYRGKDGWRDWVMIQWEEGDFPAKIWGFVDLTSMREDAQLVLRSDPNEIEVERGVYAIVESGVVVEEENPLSDIWSLVQLEEKQVDGHPDQRTKKLYVVDTESFKDPICVIPNIGSENKNEYLLMTPRQQWAEDFVTWLEMPHEHDRVEMHSPTPSEEDEEEEDVEEEESNESESELEPEEQGEEASEEEEDEEEQ